MNSPGKPFNEKGETFKVWYHGTFIKKNTLYKNQVTEFFLNWSKMYVPGDLYIKLPILNKNMKMASYSNNMIVRMCKCQSDNIWVFSFVSWYIK